MTRRLDPILFDLDGTLVDSSRDISEAVNRTLCAFGLPALPHQEIIGFVGDGVRRLIERTLACTPQGGDVDSLVAAFKADYREHCLVHTAPYPGMPELLRDLRQRRIGLVTNKPVEFARVILDAFGLSSSIGAVVGGDEAELKPSPQPLRVACERLGSDPTTGIMVGDSHNDIKAGQLARMKTCGVLWGFDNGLSVRQAHPDSLCASAEELRKTLIGGGTGGNA